MFTDLISNNESIQESSINATVRSFSALPLSNNGSNKGKGFQTNKNKEGVFLRHPLMLSIIPPGICKYGFIFMYYSTLYTDMAGIHGKPGICIYCNGFPLFTCIGNQLGSKMIIFM